VVTLPYSEGMNRFTLAATAASMRTVWLWEVASSQQIFDEECSGEDRMLYSVVLMRSLETKKKKGLLPLRLTGIAGPATVETSASTPLSAAVKDSTDVKSTSTTLMLASYAPGFLERVRTVTS